MASLTPLVKYDPMQPRDESGRWAATGAGGVSADSGMSTVTTSAAFDMDLMRQVAQLEEMDLDPDLFTYIDMYMADELQEARDYLQADWEQDNPDDVSMPDFEEQAYEEILFEARQSLDDNLQTQQELLMQNVAQAYLVEGVGKDGSEWSTDINGVSVYDGDVQIAGSFYVDGEYAGRFERTISEFEAYRALLVIEDDFAGAGIAKQFNAHEEAVYANSGIPQVRITAADLSYGDFDKPPGTYVWATQGYDWGDTPFNVKNAVQRYTTTDEYKSLPAPLRRTVDSVKERFDSLAITDPNYPTPREVSQLGRLPDSEWWAGKAVMAHDGAGEETARQGGSYGPRWSAVKRLGEAARVSEGERESQQARDDFATRGAAERSAALTQFRRMNPQLDLGQEFRIIDGVPVPILPTDAQIEQILGF